MTLDELKLRLNGLEWNDIEFKEAGGGIPARIWQTVSAFSNTTGGWIVLGVKDEGRSYSIQGITNADEVQNAFIGALRSRGKFSSPIDFQEDRLVDESKTVLVFYIPEADRTAKPVHLEGNLSEAYVRKGGTTQKCNAQELAGFLRDAGANRVEDRVLASLDPATCFDGESLRWYREQFYRRNPGHPTESRDDHGFLEHFGLLVPSNGALGPTLAAILLFGSAAACHHSMARQQVDFLIFVTKKRDTLPETRWDVRIEALSEGNLIQTWRRIVEVYQDRFASGGRFELDPTTFQGGGPHPDYLAFREAVLNLLIHQDYGDQVRKATIHAYSDVFEFWNPGASFVCGDEFFKPGDKPVRNPRIRSMLTRIGIGEQANTGIKNIYAHQRQLGRIAPIIENDVANQAFRLVLSKESSRSEVQQALLTRLGVRLTESQATIFLHCWRTGSVTLLEAQSVAGTSLAETNQALEHLDRQVLLEKIEDPPGHQVYKVQAHLREASGSQIGQVTGQVHPATGQVGGQVTGQVQAWLADVIRAAASGPLASAAIQTVVGIRHRETFQRNYLDRLLADGWLERTVPDRLHSRLQQYQLTSKARRWLVANPPSA